MSYTLHLHNVICQLYLNNKNSANFWTRVGKLWEEAPSSLIHTVGSIQFLVVVGLRELSAEGCP